MGLLNACILSLPLALMGCEPYVVQYRTKPAYHHQMASGTFTDGMTSDGIEIRWIEPESKNTSPFVQDIGGTTFHIRQEKPDGTVILQARLPQHVLINTLTCLRNAEYQLLFDKMVAASTRAFYLDQEAGYNAYESHMIKHRKEMASLINRMVVGKTFGEVETQTASDGTIRCRLRKKLRREFKFKEVLMVPEGQGLKLLTIR